MLVDYEQCTELVLIPVETHEIHQDHPMVVPVCWPWHGWWFDIMLREKAMTFGRKATGRMDIFMLAMIAMMTAFQLAKEEAW